MEIKAGEIVFLDTNVLLTATDESRPAHADANLIFRSGPQNGRHLGISGQVIREYLVVATRPLDVNGLGLDIDTAIGNIDAIRERTVFFEETEPVASHLLSLARTHALTGKCLHDAGVAATMSVHNISILVTDNSGDFAPFRDIHTVSIADAAHSMGLDNNTKGPTT